MLLHCIPDITACLYQIAESWHYRIHLCPCSGGFYHGKLVFPKDYPFRPPRIIMITPNGRFQTNTRLCLSISDFHPDTWNPAWSVATILTGLLSFMVSGVGWVWQVGVVSGCGEWGWWVGVVSEGVVVGIVSVGVVRRCSGRAKSFMGGQVYSAMCQGSTMCLPGQLKLGFLALVVNSNTLTPSSFRHYFSRNTHCFILLATRHTSRYICSIPQ